MSGPPPCATCPVLEALEPLRADVDELFLTVRTMSGALACAQSRLEEVAADTRLARTALQGIECRMREARDPAQLPDWRTLTKLAAALVAVLSLLAGALVALVDYLRGGAPLP